MTNDEIGFLVIGISLAIPVSIIFMRKVFRVNEIMENQKAILNELI